MLGMEEDSIPTVWLMVRDLRSLESVDDPFYVAKHHHMNIPRPQWNLASSFSLNTTRLIWACLKLSHVLLIGYELAEWELDG